MEDESNADEEMILDENLITKEFGILQHRHFTAESRIIKFLRIWLIRKEIFHTQHTLKISKPVSF